MTIQRKVGDLLAVRDAKGKVVKGYVVEVRSDGVFKLHIAEPHDDDSEHNPNGYTWQFFADETADFGLTILGPWVEPVAGSDVDGAVERLKSAHDVLCFRSDMIGWQIARNIAADLRTILSALSEARETMRMDGEALEAIADEAPFRSGYDQTDIEYAPKLSDVEMQTKAQARLAARAPQSGEAG